MLQLHSLSSPNRLIEVSAEFNSGECWHLLGPNGSGKSSVLTAIAGLLQIEGRLLWHDMNIDKPPQIEHAQFRCLLPQKHQLYFEVTVKECFFMLHQSFHIPELLLDTLQLEQLQDKPVFSLSGGEQQRVYIALHLTQVWPAIEKGNALVLLDEPTQQLDPFFQIKTLELIANVSQLGNVVIQSHHDVNQTLEFASHAMLIKKHQVLNQGKVNDVIKSVSMQALYNQDFIELNDKSTSKRYLVVK